MSLFNLLIALLFAALVPAEWTNPQDALVNPRGKKVCLQQCGTAELLCPEAFVRVLIFTIEGLLFRMIVLDDEGRMLTGSSEERGKWNLFPVLYYVGRNSDQSGV